MNRFLKKLNSNGSTIIEVSLVITISLVLFVVFQSAAKDYLSSRSVDKQSQLLESYLKTYRAVAQESGRTIVISFNTSSKTISANFESTTKTDEEGNMVSLFKPLILEKKLVALKVAFGSVANKRNQARYYPSGSATPGTIILRGEKGHCVIKQALRGALRRWCY